MMHFLPPALALLLAFALVCAPVHAVQQYGYRVLEQRAQPRENFVQGLEIQDKQLLVSTGMYGESRLRRYDFASMNLLAERRLNPRLFGEGITQYGDRIYQLTWRSRTGIAYRAKDLIPLQTFALPGEGWGLTHSSDALVYSDGTHILRFLEPASLLLRRSLEVTANGMPVGRLNELEWIEGRIWANIWPTDQIAIIHPDSGEVEAIVNLGGLLPPEERQEGTDVLNGIACDPATGAIWVTGKRWPYLYRIELIPAANNTRSAENR